MEGNMISVVIPCYNCAKYVKQAIDSVLAQEIEAEIILVNDGSTDEIDMVIEPYLKRGNVRYIKNIKNQGVAKSRNIGVKEAKGNFIAFLDADDWWDERKLTMQMEFITKRDVAFCFTARKLWMENINEFGKVIQAPKKVTYDKLLKNNCIPCSSVLIRREVLLAYPVMGEDIHEDYLLWLNILKDGLIAYGINEPLVFYRVRKKSRSSCKVKTLKKNYDLYRYVGMGKVKSVKYSLLNAIIGVLKYYF